MHKQHIFNIRSYIKKKTYSELHSPDVIVSQRTFFFLTALTNTCFLFKRLSHETGDLCILLSQWSKDLFLS